MQIINIDSYGRPTLEGVDLAVSSSGMVVTVGAGNVVLSEVTYVLDEDATTTLVSDPVHKTYATVYLCRDPNGDLKVVVDEMVGDPEDPPVPYNWSESALTLLFQLAYVEVVAGALDLDAAPATVWRVVPRQEE